MSEEKAERSLKLSGQDIDAIEKLMDHFNFPKSKEYVAAVAAFRADPNNVQIQHDAIYQIAKSVGEVKGKNELVDEIFTDLLPACVKISYDMKFDRDLEEVIGQDPTNPE